MSTRRLKRFYLRALRRVWHWDSKTPPSRFDYTHASFQRSIHSAHADRTAATAELGRRGWTA